MAFETNSLASTNDLARQLEATREVLNARLNNFGVHFSIEPQAQERLLLKVARLGSNELAAVRQVISKPGLLEFRIVHTNSEELVRAGTAEPGYELLKEKRRMPDDVAACGILFIFPGMPKWFGWIPWNKSALPCFTLVI